jgi:HAD superfamily hydrolase (TIGR01662 family)
MDNSHLQLKVVFFDLGSTLIYSKDPWAPIYEHADRELVNELLHAGIPLNEGSFSSEFDTFLASYYAMRGNGTLETTTFSALQELLEQKGFHNVPDEQIRAALDAMYAITQKNWYLELDAIPTLEKLRSQGYRLGMISNTSDDINVQQIVDRDQLRSYFEVIITSAGCGIRKPDERIFQLALDHFGIPPGQAVMVGDTLEADILGANRLGMYSIWITRRVQVLGEGELDIQPQAVIASLSQLPDLLFDIKNDMFSGLSA